MVKFKSISTSLVLLCAVAYIVYIAAAAKAPEAAAPELALAPGWGDLGYELPQPGTYKLPVIQRAAGGKVVKAGGGTADLSDFLGDKLTVLSFIYTSCNDVNGCPLSIFVMHQLQDRLKREPEIAKHLRLVSLSFDVKNDTPEVLRAFQQEHGSDADHSGHAGHGGQGGDEEHSRNQAGQHKGSDWFFLVGASEQELKPLLKSYSQFVIPEINESSEKTGQFAHLLRVFLIDKHGAGTQYLQS